MLIDVERHGREQILDEVNLSRTVGWFTSVAPILFDLRESRQPEEALRIVKEQLQQLSDGGIGYGLLRYLSTDTATRKKLQALPRAQVVFNYLGHSSQALSQDALFISDSASAGPPRSPRGLRTYLLDIEAVILGGRLDIHCRYSTNIHDRSSIEQLAQGMVQSLRLLSDHCQTLDAEQNRSTPRPLDIILSQVRFSDDE